MWSWAVYLSSLNLSFLTSKRKAFDLMYFKVSLPSSVNIWQGLPSLITNMETDLNKIVFIAGSSFKKQFYFTFKKITKGRLMPFVQVFVQVWFLLGHSPQSHLGRCAKKRAGPHPRPTESGPLGLGPGK